MLTIHVPESVLYIEDENRFIDIKAHSVTLEHSLLSVSKWEERWRKSFFRKEKKTTEEVIDYIHCMSISNKFLIEDLSRVLSQTQIEAIITYVDSSRTATVLTKDPFGKKGNSSELVTSELIYYWMTEFKIPFECQKWHLSRLLILIEIANRKNQPPKKMSKSEVAKRNSSLNQIRRAALNSKG